MTATARPGRILVIDDDPEMCDAVAGVLRLEQHQVEAAALGREGLERLAARPFDVAVVDIRLPDVPGLGLLSAIKSARPDTEVILITGHASLPSAIDALNGGAFGYLEKPFEPGQLLAAIDRALEKQTLVRALRESESSFRLLFAGNPHPMWVYDRETLGFLEVNEAASARYGYTRDEFLRMRLTDIRPAEDVPELLADVARARPPLQSARPRRHMLQDGRVIDVEVSSHTLVFAGREAVLVVAQDVTARRQAQAALQQSEEALRRLAAIVESSDDAIVGTDLDGIVTTWNRGAERLYGYAADEMVGRPVSRLTPDDRRAERADIIERLMRGEPVEHYETVRLAKSEDPIDVSMTVSLIRDAEGRVTGASAISRDVTRRKRAEAEILRLNAQLEDRVQQRTAELEAANRELEAFSYSVSHDLRAPLRAIDGFSRILLEDHAPALSPETRRYLDLIRTNTRQMGQLVDDLLALARLGRKPLATRPVMLDALVREVLDELAGERNGRRVEIVVGRLPICQADPALLKQVVANLLGNALKFTRPRAVGRVEVGCQPTETPPVYYVRDNGVGFDMRYADKLFGVFQRLHRAEDYEGTGVGLAIVHRIVQRHGGRVWAEGEVDKGATVYFTLAGGAGS